MEAFASPEAKRFRQRMVFHCATTVGFTCAVYLMGMLRAVLEPFFWALFLVTALVPLARFFECLLLEVGQFFCGRFTYSRPRRCRLFRSSSQAEELVATGSPAGFDDVDVGASPLWRIPNDESDVTLKESCCACFARFISVLSALAVVLFAVLGVATIIIDGAIRVQEDIQLYEIGARQVEARVKHLVKSLSLAVPEAFLTTISEKLMESGKLVLSSAVGGLLGYAGKVVFELLMLGLYVLFWLCAPMPLNSKTETIFRRYLFLKGTACLGYGVCVGLLLHMLKVQLPIVYGLTSFVLSFIPEVGAFLAMALSVPVILFDSRLETPLATLLTALAAQIGLKFLFANVVEVKLVENDSTMKMHPVVTLLAVTFFGFLWGPTGMLLSVPMMTYLKAVLLAEYVPAGYRDPLLILIEGDRRAPRRLRAKKPGRKESEDPLESLASADDDWHTLRHNSD